MDSRGQRVLSINKVREGTDTFYYKNGKFGEFSQDQRCNPARRIGAISCVGLPRVVVKITEPSIFGARLAPRLNTRDLFFCTSFS